MTKPESKSRLPITEFSGSPCIRFRFYFVNYIVVNCRKYRENEFECNGIWSSGFLPLFLPFPGNIFNCFFFVINVTGFWPTLQTSVPRTVGWTLVRQRGWGISLPPYRYFAKTRKVFEIGSSNFLVFLTNACGCPLYPFTRLNLYLDLLSVIWNSTTYSSFKSLLQKQD